MSAVDIDFEGASNQPPVENTNEEEVTNFNGNDKDDVNQKENNDETSNTEQKQTEKTEDTETSSTGELEVGDTLEVDGVTYTVAENGDIVDKDNNVFKPATEVKEWLKSMTIEDDKSSSEFNINSIQEAVGITVTDENGNNVEFTNDTNGVKAYIDSVIELRSNELQEAAINRLYADNPLLKQLQDYVEVTGTARGFGDLPDRSTVNLDKDNEHQQISIIKQAALEFGNKSLNDNYIKYLKDTGSLYDEAKTQLAALVNKDVEVRKEIENKAKAQREQQQEEAKEYWDNIHNIISKRDIGGYRIPENFIKEVNGKKTTVTPDDFFNYIANNNVVDENGNRITQYQKDLADLEQNEHINRDLVNAWLMFTGGTYKDLIDMAVKEDKVRQLRMKSKENRSAKSVKIIKTNTKSSVDDILL